MSRVATHIPRTCIRHYATGAVKPSIYGQPLFRSHPHLVKHNELTAGIPSEDYERRRRSLMDSLPENSVVISLAAPIKYMSNNIFYKYRQASDFWYLTGFEEPDSALILEKTSSSRGYRMTLFSRGSDTHLEKWEGARTSHHDLASFFSPDPALPMATFPSHLRSLLPLYSHIYIDLPTSASTPFRRKPTSILKYLSRKSESVWEYDTILEKIASPKRRPLSPEVSRLRSIKSEAEKKVMKAAADISCRAHTKTMRFARPGLSESALAAHFEYLCALEGSQRPAYVPVVASGENALIIHYTSNNHLLREGEMVLMDAGCEYNGYASDITRTFPTSGSFTPTQLALYSAVLSVQKSLITLCTSTRGLSMNDLHRKSCELLREELTQIGFSFTAEGELEKLYPHFLSHPVGIDLHESSNFDRSALLQEGMVITIEPGIYVPPSPSFPKAFHGMGVRIEDEVLIGRDHPIVLSVNVPKEVADVEGACQGILGLEAI